MATVELHKTTDSRSAILRPVCISIAIHLVVIAVAAASSAFMKQETKAIVIRLYSEDAIADNRAEDAGKMQAFRKQRQELPVKSKDKHIKSHEPVLEKAVSEKPVERAAVSTAQKDVSVPSPAQQVLPSVAGNAKAAMQQHNSDWSAAGSTMQAAPVSSSVVAANDAIEKAETSRRNYLKEHFEYIKDRIYKNLVYPARAKKMGWSGKVMISFIICEDGRVKDLKIVKSSGFEVLDLNVVDTVKDSQPFPRPPVRAELLLPVSYVIQ